jgi:hypothetical protein
MLPSLTLPGKAGLGKGISALLRLFFAALREIGFLRVKFMHDGVRMAGTQNNGKGGETGTDSSAGFGGNKEKAPRVCGAILHCLHSSPKRKHQASVMGKGKAQADATSSWRLHP